MSYTYENLIIGGQDFDYYFNESGLSPDEYDNAYSEWQKNHLDELDIAEEENGVTANGLVVNGKYWVDGGWSDISWWEDGQLVTVDVWVDGYWGGTDGWLGIYSENVKLYNTTVNGGYVDLGRNNYATGTIINGGEVYAVGQTVVCDTTINGGQLRLSSGIGRDITVNGGTLELAYYAVLEGTINIAKGAKLFADHEADTLAPTNKGTINIALDSIDEVADTAIQVSRLGGTGTVNITVASALTEGTYALVFDRDPWDLERWERFNEVTSFLENTNTINLTIGGNALGDIRTISGTVSVGGYDYTFSPTYFSSDDHRGMFGEWHYDERTEESTWIGDLSGINLTVTVSEVVVPDDRIAGVDLNSAKSKVSKYNLSLSWAKAVPSDTSIKIAGYEIEVNGTIYSTKSTSFSLKNLDLGSYECRVRAIDSTGDSGAWGDSQTFTVVDVTPPTVKNLKITVDGYNLGLSWTGEDKKGEITSYTIKLDGEVRETLNGNAATFTLSLSEAYVGKHKIEVIAYDGVNYSKAASKTITVKDAAPPEQVTGLSSPAVRDSKYKTVLAWTIPFDNSGKVTRYEILLDGKIYKSSKPELKTGKLLVGEHTYQVRAIDQAKNVGEWSEVTTFTVADVTAPGKVSAKAKVSDNWVGIEWKAAKDNVGVTGYEVWFGDSKDNPNLAYELEANQLSCDFSGLDKGNWYYGIVAIDEAGNRSTLTASKLTIKTELAAAADLSSLSSWDNHSSGFLSTVSSF